MLFNYRYFVLCHFTNSRLQAFVAMQSIMLAMGSVGKKKLACAIRVEMKYWREVIQFFDVQFPIFCPLSPHHPPN